MTHHAAPERSGRLRIVAEDGPIISVLAKDGTRYQFDALERTFIAP